MGFIAGTIFGIALCIVGGLALAWYIMRDDDA